MGVFSPQNSVPGAYYWIVAGIVTPASQVLCIFTQTIINTKTFFEQIGTDVVLVWNWQGLDPGEWQYNTSRITQSNGVLTWNNGVTYNGGSGGDDYIYVLGGNAATAQTVLARITDANLVQCQWNLMQFWAGSGKAWVVGDSSSLQGLFPGKYNEGSLIFNEYMKEWYIISLQAEENFIWLSHSQNLTGTWSSVPVYEIPSGWSKSPFISYAAKSHPEYAEANQIIITYNTNRNDGLGPMVSDIAIYHPHFVQLDISL